MFKFNKVKIKSHIFDKLECKKKKHFFIFELIFKIRLKQINRKK